MTLIPNHIREQFERIEEVDDPLEVLEPIGALREWLRESELHAIKQASEHGASLARIGNALGTDKQNIHQRLRTTSNAKGFTSPEFDGVISSTLRYWLWWWSSPERSPGGVEEKGRDPREQATMIRAELEAREAAGLLRKPIDATRSADRTPSGMPLAAAPRRRHHRRVSVKRAAEIALRDRLVSLGVGLDADARAEHLREVVVDTIDDASLGQALADLRVGSGGELTATANHRPKFHSAFSSCALAVNAFGVWRLDLTGLRLDGESGFATMRFEAQRPIFTSRATPPNLDVLLEGAEHIVAIESKLTEYLNGNERASFADRYDHSFGEVAHESWRDLYALLKGDPGHFHFLKADQLLKHYLGLKRAQQLDPQPVTLIYLYWEPSNPDSHDAFKQHRVEAEEFAERVADVMVPFKQLSYPELWEQSLASVDTRLHEHVARLRERYEVSVAPQ